MYSAACFAWNLCTPKPLSMELKSPDGRPIVVIISGSAVLLRTLVTSHQRFHNLIKILGRAHLDELLACRKGVYLHRTTQHRKKISTNIHASSRVRTHDPSNQAAKTYAVDCADTVTGGCPLIRGSEFPVTI
jgi:hypothetical protein